MPARRRHVPAALSVLLVVLLRVAGALTVGVFVFDPGGVGTTAPPRIPPWRPRRGGTPVRRAPHKESTTLIIRAAGWRSNSKDVTAPKFPPPPRSARNMSGCSASLAWTSSPSAVTRSTDRRLSIVRPCGRAKSTAVITSAAPADRTTCEGYFSIIALNTVRASPYLSSPWVGRSRWSRSSGARTALSPDEAFSLLGNETRVRTLQTLGEAEGPLVVHGTPRPGRHPTGRAVQRPPRQAGGAFRRENRRRLRAPPGGPACRRGGAFGRDHRRPDGRTDRSRGVAVPVLWHPDRNGFSEERVERYCTESPGLYDESVTRALPGVEGEYRNLGVLDLPPAGVQGRSADEILGRRSPGATRSDWSRPTTSARAVPLRSTAPERSASATTPTGPSATGAGGDGW
jgi:hypothetical protein